MKNLKKIEIKGSANHDVFNTIKMLTIACFTVSIIVMSCSGGDDSNLVGECGDFNWIEGAEEQINTWNNAAFVYSENPTTANCNAYKTAGANYLNVLEDVKNCVPSAGLSDFNEAIQKAKSELAQLDCP